MRRLFTAATLLGSALLFAVQPMIARALLPHTGGVPALWNTCAVFFQAALLVGYAYAHAAPRALGDRRVAPLHVALLALAALTLPFALGSGSPLEGDPTAWILVTLAARVLPVFALLSTGAPLLQRWFVASAPGRDPSPLIAASNAGSLAALVAYPFVIEPLVPLAAQSRAFSAAFALYVAVMAACAWSALRAPPAPVDAPTPRAAIATRPWLRLVALAFVPSSMMLGLTAHIATDVGSFPLLWVAPLVVYLASFIAVFARPPEAPGPRTLAPFLGLLQLMFLFSAPQVATRLPLVVAHFALFGWCAYLLHGELARSRPSDASITSFQLAIAVGGALGGVFNALVAPRLFVRVTEYPLAMALAVLLLPHAPEPVDPRAREEALLRTAGLDPLAVLGPAAAPRPARRWTLADALVPLAVGALAAWLFVTPSVTVTRAPSLLRYGLPLAALTLLSIRRRPRLALGLLAILAASRADRAVLHASRSFYGVLRVEESRGVRRFLHGTTLHGLEYRSPKMRGRAVGYYDANGPVGELMASLAPALEGRRIGVVGLGVGMLIAHARPGQRWTFYELDPDVVRVAQRWFTWLRDARAPWRIVTGDARRSLAREAGDPYRLLVLDAFSSDAIPTHLLTREALAVYRARTDAHGVIAVHVTNRHVRLAPVLAALARDANMIARVRCAPVAGPDGPIATTWVLLARSDDDLGPIARDARWVLAEAAPDARPWTDDFSNVLSVLRLR